MVMDVPILTLSLAMKDILEISNKSLASEEQDTNIPKIKFWGNYSLLLQLMNFLFNRADDKERILNILFGTGIISFSLSSDAVENLIYFNRVNPVFKLFEKINQIKGKTNEPNSFLFELIHYHDEYNTKKEGRYLLREEFCERVLNGKNISNTLFKISFYNLSNLKKGAKFVDLAKLHSFLQKYLEAIIMDNENKKYHLLCRLLGEQIGKFSAEEDKKDLLYKLREISNIQRLVEFIRDFIYEVDKSGKGYFIHTKVSIPEEDGIITEKNYAQLIDDLLTLVSGNKNVSFVGDLLGIYSVQKFLSQSYSLKKKQGGENNE